MAENWNDKDDYIDADICHALYGCVQGRFLYYGEIQKKKGVKMKKERDNFYKKVLILVLPMALQNLINVGVSATDVMMLGAVGEKVLSGCSLGGQVFWILSLFLFGAASGGSVLVTQRRSKRSWGSRSFLPRSLPCSLWFCRCFSRSRSWRCIPMIPKWRRKA